MTAGRPEENSTFDPPVHISYHGRECHICVDLPDTTEEQIRIDLEKTALTLSIIRDGSVDKKIIRIPGELRLFRKKVTSGVLEIVLEKPVTGG
ncbi:MULTISPECIES: CS domain-containing protein [unclassified Methanoregula]|uniref:CS domain-containing protein n=1 Tax=unclassified Methanoregula TaxID=2649730 RepID=UPI0009C614D4|nr:MULTISPECIES: CS domain-containing protein [unclassified Methanoregula]OPX61766.1 MAG: hypothetical protein A4E33_02868 [Methanoregula sp. PtaB.Bin085]OPY33925.1 MAG: hypothetical protein A4E34_01510 [Methanoregula sp. PtaU1.Bin006]